MQPVLWAPNAVGALLAVFQLAVSSFYHPQPLHSRMITTATAVYSALLRTNNKENDDKKYHNNDENSVFQGVLFHNEIDSIAEKRNTTAGLKPYDGCQKLPDGTTYSPMQHGDAESLS